MAAKKKTVRKSKAAMTTIPVQIRLPEKSVRTLHRTAELAETSLDVTASVLLAFVIASEKESKNG